MTGPERGFLLLRSSLGDPNRKPLTQAQLRNLERIVRNSEQDDPDRELTAADLWNLGCTLREAQHIVRLLSEEKKLDAYLSWGAQRGCAPVTRATPGYPRRVLECLKEEAPGCLWAKGDLSLLKMEKIALVGSRDLRIPNAFFAQKVGRLAAELGIVLVSGNARGADTVAQDACLAAGGKVISVVADCLHRHPEKENVLYLSEESFEADFSAQRALSRNRVIHTLAPVVYVAQCTYHKGGTWEGTKQNLENRWSSVICFDDGTPSMAELAALGAERIDAPHDTFPG